MLTRTVQIIIAKPEGRKSTESLTKIIYALQYILVYLRRKMEYNIVRKIFETTISGVLNPMLTIAEAKKRDHT